MVIIMSRQRKQNVEGVIKMVEKSELVEEEYLPEVKFIIVPIKLGMGDSGGVFVREADEVVSKWIRKGYTLLSAVRGEFIPDKRVQVICTLVRKE